MFKENSRYVHRTHTSLPYSLKGYNIRSQNAYKTVT